MADERKAGKRKRKRKRAGNESESGETETETERERESERERTPSLLRLSSVDKFRILVGMLGMCQVRKVGG